MTGFKATVAPWFTRSTREAKPINVATPTKAKADVAAEKNAPVDGLESSPKPIDTSALQSGAAVAGVRAHDLKESLPLSDVATNVAWQFKSVLGPNEAASTQEIAARAQELEDRAFEVLEVLTPTRVGHAEAAFDVWFTAIEDRQKGGGKVEMLEHLTVLHVMKSKMFAGQSELEPYLPRMEKLLLSSDKAMTGRDRSIEQVLSKRLPRSVLSQQSADAQKIHAAVFASGNDNFCSAISDLVKNYVPSAKDPIIAVGILAALFTGTGAQLLGGAIHGYLIGTLLEHAIHSKLGHATPKTMEKMEGFLARFGPIGRAVHKYVDSVRFGHAVIHHGSYGQNYVDRFAPNDPRLTPEQAAQKKEAKKELIDKWANDRGPEEAADIFKSDYGRQLAHALRNAMVTAPVTALVTLFSGAVAAQAGIGVGALFVAASVVSSLLFIPASNYLHPYLHMPREEAMSKAGPLMRAFLNSRYVSHIAQHHYLHHKDARVNHNLVPGADFALGYEPTQVEAVVALRKLKSFY